MHVRRIHSLFYYPRHRAIHQAIDETTQLTLENLMSHLAKQSQLEKVGGMNYLFVLYRAAQDHHSSREADAYLATLEALADIRKNRHSSWES